jgi:hypothetical protein
MRKLILMLTLIFAVGLSAFAQQSPRVVKKTEKVKKTSSLGQKVHNTFSKHKEHNGYKVKKKVRNK